jgi:SAM-dependent methyltransferase
MQKESYELRSICRLCSSPQLALFLNLGKMPLAGNFLLKKNIGKEKFYPLELYRCLDCSLVQVLHLISPEELFNDYRYLSSVSLTKHFTEYAVNVVKRFDLKNKLILEIGSNDGVLLTPFKNLGVKVLGIDPAKNVAAIANKKGLSTIADFFSVVSARKILHDYGFFKAIFANNVLAHIDTIRDVFEGITIILDTDGVLVFEVHYLPELLIKLQYDFFYHEHMSYYTITCLKPFIESFGLVIFDVKKISIHSGSIRVFVKHKENHSLQIRDRVERFLSFEKDFFDQNVIYETFSKKVEKQKQKLTQLLKKLHKQKKKIIGYGASGRGNTLLNFCGIDTNLINYIVDDSPERYGRYTPGTHIPIVPRTIFQSDTVDYALLLAWNYKRSILAKEEKYLARGGSFIFPLPTVTSFSQHQHAK